jgi:oligopeptide transport system substrate-binding protein
MSERQVGYEEAMYASLEAAGTGVIDIQINYPTSDDQNTKWGSIFNNYDFSMWSGWGPDYADPQTFLQTFKIGGDMVEYIGFGKGTPENEALEKSVLGAYTELFDKAVAIVDPTLTKERYKAFAEAEYALIYEYAVIVPWLAQNEYVASVAKTIPYQAGRASYGLTQYKFKNVVVSNETITKELHSKILLEYELEKYN